MTSALAVSQGLSRLSKWWRTLAIAYWLGWQIESNWTDPPLFLGYSIIRPLSTMFMFVLIFFVITQKLQGPMLAFFVVGSAFWPFVVAGMQGTAWSLIADRDQWNTLRYVYSAPISLYAYLVGRSLAHFAPACVSAGVTLGVGRWILGLPFRVDQINLWYFLAGLALGLASIVSFAVFVASAVMLASSESWQIPEGVGAFLYLFSGAIFPLHLLPGALQAAGQVLPLTWWLEVMRRALLGTEAVRSVPWANEAQVLGILAILAGAFMALSAVAFRWADHRARRLGILESQSAY